MDKIKQKIWMPDRGNKWRKNLFRTQLRILYYPKFSNQQYCTQQLLLNCSILEIQMLEVTKYCTPVVIVTKA